MQLWRLSSARHAHDFSGAYGLLHPGRWNTPGRPITYCSTVPSLTALEKRVHVTDPSLLPPLLLVEYSVPTFHIGSASVLPLITGLPWAAQ